MFGSKQTIGNLLTPLYDAQCGISYEFKYLGEIETQFENTLRCLSGSQMGSNHEKNRGRKSRDTLPLSCKGPATLPNVF